MGSRTSATMVESKSVGFRILLKKSVITYLSKKELILSEDMVFPLSSVRSEAVQCTYFNSFEVQITNWALTLSPLHAVPDRLSFSPSSGTLFFLNRMSMLAAEAFIPLLTKFQARVSKGLLSVGSV